MQLDSQAETDHLGHNRSQQLIKLKFEQPVNTLRVINQLLQTQSKSTRLNQDLAPVSRNIEFEKLEKLHTKQKDIVRQRKFQSIFHNIMITGGVETSSRKQQASARAKNLSFDGNLENPLDLPQRPPIRNITPLNLTSIKKDMGTSMAEAESPTTFRCEVSLTTLSPSKSLISNNQGLNKT